MAVLGGASQECIRELRLTFGECLMKFSKDPTCQNTYFNNFKEVTSYLFCCLFLLFLISLIVIVVSTSAAEQVYKSCSEMVPDQKIQYEILEVKQCRIMVLATDLQTSAR